MKPRIISTTLVSLVLACTTTTPDDSAETEPATSGASTSSTAGTSGTSGATSGPAGSSESGSGPASESTSPDAPTTTGIGTEVTGADAGESDSSGEPGTTGGVAVSFTEVYEQVIMPNGCNSGYCHGMGAGGLEMTDEATSYANLVEVAAVAALCDQTMRVVPGSLDESILWYRVRPSTQDGDNTCAQGSKMPKGSMGLTDAEAKLVSDWISGGALE